MGIPILDDILLKFTEKSLLDNFVDRAHYVATTVLLFYFSALISAKQIFGSPIRCMSPGEYGSGWGDYVDSFCFSTSTYTTAEGGHQLFSESDRVNIGYYQWVPYAFLVMAALFYLPHLLWSGMSRSKTDVDFESVVKKSLSIRQQHDSKKRARELKEVAAYLCKVNRCREGRRGIARGLGAYGCHAYIASKALNLLNVAAQFLFVCSFVGQGQLGWGFKLVYDALNGSSLITGGYFPRQAYCEFFQMSDLAEPQKRLAQCILMINMINEKLFAICYFWFLALFLATLVDLMRSIVRYILGRGFSSFSGRYLKLMDKVNAEEMVTEQELRRFVLETLGKDGLLLFEFIDNHAGSAVAGEVACAYYVKARTDPDGAMDEVELKDDEKKDDKKGE